MKIEKDTAVRIIPRKLIGNVQVPSSKSMGHREIICAGLAKGMSVVDNISMSKDIEATMRALRALGVHIEETVSKFDDRVALKITGTGTVQAAEAGVDCGESGSTLRFFIPLGALLGEAFTFTGHGKLVSRPLDAYYDIFAEKGIEYKNAEGNLPLTVNGKLSAGVYRLPGDVSSQFVSGLLFALPLVDGDSVVEITSPLESASYVDLTISCLAKYGVKIENEQGAHRRYLIKGNQAYQAQKSMVEGDWSQAAFWLVAGALGKSINCRGLDFNSLQGDMAIVEIMERMGARFIKCAPTVLSGTATCKGTVIDAANCPDIVPILSALAAVSEGRTQIINAGRLRIKECDRLAAMTSELNKLGAEVIEEAEGLTIIGKPVGLPGGVTVDAWNDHRIAMSLAVVAQKCAEPIIITGAGSVSKSYPNFWEDYHQLDGEVEVQHE